MIGLYSLIIGKAEGIASGFSINSKHHDGSWDWTA